MMPRIKPNTNLNLWYYPFIFGDGTWGRIFSLSGTLQPKITKTWPWRGLSSIYGAFIPTAESFLPSSHTSFSLLLYHLSIRDLSFPAFAGFPASMKFKFLHFYFFFSQFWWFLAQIHTLSQTFQALSFRSAYIPAPFKGSPLYCIWDCVWDKGQFTIPVIATFMSKREWT